MDINSFGKLIDSIEALRGEVYHNEAVEVEYPFVVYFEYNRGYLRAENRANRYCANVQVSYFTKTYKDPIVQEIEALLNDNEIVFDYREIYEKEDSSFHHIFDCELQ